VVEPAVVDPAVAVATQASAEERQHMLEVAAYFIAERDGFQGSTTHYWSLAESEIAARLGETPA
jgi:hypothetical protein